MGMRGPSLRKLGTEREKKKEEKRGACEYECEHGVKDKIWRGRERTGGGQGAVLVARTLEDEVRERLGASGGLGRSVAREVVECGGEDGTYVELSR